MTKRPTWAWTEATPVTEDYKEGDDRFTGTIQKVTVELKP